MLVWILSVAALAGEPVAVEIAVSGPGEVRVRALEGDIFVPACRGVSWSIFNRDSGRFEATLASVSEPLMSAIKIDKGGHLFTIDVALPPLPGVGFHILRPTLVYGLKCLDETPFPLAQCGQISAVDGPQLVVRNRGTVRTLGPVKPE
jgi:hypothetical protein